MDSALYPYKLKPKLAKFVSKKIKEALKMSRLSDNRAIVNCIRFSAAINLPFCEAEHQRDMRKTRREIFLELMDKLIPRT